MFSKRNAVTAREAMMRQTYCSGKTITSLKAICKRTQVVVSKAVSKTGDYMYERLTLSIL